MIVAAMLISGAVAGLVGLPILFGESYNYGSTFQSGLGFAGIAIALLGRNNPIGIAIGALLFAFLNEQSNPLQILVRRLARHRRDHPGRHRPDGGHLLRARAPRTASASSSSAVARALRDRPAPSARRPA